MEISPEQASEYFLSTLLRRLDLKSSEEKSPLQHYSYCLLHLINLYPDLKFFLDEKIDELLKDCEIYCGMSDDKAMDMLNELSSLATIYCTDKEHSRIYNRICSLIKGIQASYPAQL